MQTQSNKVERISRQELKDMLKRAKTVVLVDARDVKGYEARDTRPKDSVRIAPDAFDGEVACLPKDKLIMTA